MKLFDLMNPLKPFFGGIASIGSNILASILYQTKLGDFVYKTDINGNTVLDNQQYNGTDAPTYSGRGIELGATNDADIPIHHTFGGELITAPSSIDTGWTDNLDGTYTCDGTSGFIRFPIIYTIGNTYFNSLEIVSITSGSVTNIYDGTAGNRIDYNTIGVKEDEMTADVTKAFIYSNSFIGTVRPITIKQITNQNSYLTYYDFTDGLVTVDNSLNTPSTKYTLNTKTVNNFLTHTTPWSASDWAKINNNPNLIGKLALETTGATKTIPELDMVMDAGASDDSYYMCSERSGAYLVDSRVAYGAELFTNSDFSSAVGWTVGSGATITGGELVYNAVGVTAAVFQGILTQGLIYKIEFDVTEYTSGALQCGAGVALDEVKIAEGINAIGHYSYIFKAGTGAAVGFRTDIVDFIGKVDNATLKQATAIEIANYAETIRTNADLQQKGIQTTAFVIDGTGVPTSYSSNLLQFNGDGRYVDTQLMPPSDSAWEIDFVMECKADGVIKLNGVYASSNTNWFLFGQSNNNGLYGYIGSTLIGNSAIAVSDGLHYIRIEFDGAGGGNFVIDNITTYSFSGSNYTYTTSESIFLGLNSRLKVPTFLLSLSIATDIATFQYTERERTASERNAYYANLKTIYPSIP